MSDSSDSDDEPSTSAKVVENGKKSTAPTNSISQASGTTTVDLKSIHDNLRQMEDAKTKLMNYKSAKVSDKAFTGSQKENFNINDLLAMGEANEPSTSTKKSSQKRGRGDDSDSDGWEEVEGKRVKRPKYFKILERFEYKD